MKKKAQQKYIWLTCLLLCCVLTLNSSVAPLTVWASVTDDAPSQTEDNAGDDADGDINEPTAPVATTAATTVATTAPTAEQSEEDIAAAIDAIGEKYQPQIDAIANKQKELDAEKAMIQKNINAAASAREKEQATKSYLDQQIYITQTNIDLLTEKIALLEEDIADKLMAIEAKQGEYDANYAQFRKRLRSMQLSGGVTQLGAILGSDDLAGYMAATDMMTRMADYDRALMTRVKEERAALELEKRNLETTQRMLEEDSRQAEADKKLLDEQRKTALSRIQDIEQMEREFMADLKANQQRQKQMENELQLIYQKIEWEKSAYVGGEMLWPVPGYYNVTSAFGWRWNRSDFHTGMDISGSGVYGKPIVAANDGKVAFVNTAFSQGVGYGIYVIIDHGGGISTLYGHASRIVVSVGQQVKRGEKIAEVGSTGWSTGPHLHFEVREGGDYKDPAPYLKFD